MTDPGVLIVRNGQVLPIWRMEPGDRLAVKEYCPERQCLMLWIRTENVPMSADVARMEEWDCNLRGHRFAYGNQACMECTQTYGWSDTA